MKKVLKEGRELATKIHGGRAVQAVGQQVQRFQGGENSWPDQGTEQGPAWLERPEPGRSESGGAGGGQAMLNLDHLAFTLSEMRSYQRGWTEEGYAPINLVMGSGVVLDAGMGIACGGGEGRSSEPIRALMSS